MNLVYKPHPEPQVTPANGVGPTQSFIQFNEDQLPSKQIKLLKTYGDFKRLNEMLIICDLIEPIPELPEKFDDQGYKKTGGML